MVNELCQLADSGIDITHVAILGAILFGIGVTLFACHRKFGVRVTWLLPILVLVFTLGIPLQQAVFAQTVSDCSTTQDQSGGSGDQTPGTIGGLVDDNPVVSEDGSGWYAARFLILNNDNAPSGDPFDVNTLRLIGNFPKPLNWRWVGSGFNILDPNDQTPLIDPDMPDSSPNYWGYWELEVCDGTYGDCSYGQTGCDDYTNQSTCVPTGYVIVHLNSNVPPGTPLTIQYDVKTQSAQQLSPAAITVSIPVPSPITASTSILFNGPCYTWDLDPELYPDGFSVNLMDGINITTTGSGALLPSTIDLDPSTPGRQDTVTIYSQDYPSIYTTFTVDSDGIITMTDPSFATGSSLSLFLYFTIQDELGNTSNIGTFTYHFNGCG